MEATIETGAYDQADQQGVIELILKIQREEFGIPITLDAQPDLQAIAAFYQTGKGGFWVARKNRKVIGTIGLKDIGSSRVALRKMFVDAAFRGRQYGVARRLLDVLVHEAKKQAVTDIFLGTTDKFVAAHFFYEKNGFVEIDKAALPPSFPIMAVDTKFYALRLKCLPEKQTDFSMKKRVKAKDSRNDAIQ